MKYCDPSWSEASGVHKLKRSGQNTKLAWFIWILNHGLDFQISGRPLNQKLQPKSPFPSYHNLLSKCPYERGMGASDYPQTQCLQLGLRPCPPAIVRMNAARKPTLLGSAPDKTRKTSMSPKILIKFDEGKNLIKGSEGIDFMKDRNTCYPKKGAHKHETLYQLI